MSDNIPPSLEPYVDPFEKEYWRDLPKEHRVHLLEEARANRDFHSPALQEEIQALEAKCRYWMQKRFGRELRAQECIDWMVAEKGLTIAQAKKTAWPDFIEMLEQDQPDKPDKKADTNKNKVPCAKTRELIRLIKINKRKGISQIETAIEFTNGDKDKAESCLRDVRRFPDLLKPDN